MAAAHAPAVADAAAALPLVLTAPPQALVGALFEESLALRPVDCVALLQLGSCRVAAPTVAVPDMSTTAALPRALLDKWLDALAHRIGQLIDTSATTIAIPGGGGGAATPLQQLCLLCKALRAAPTLVLPTGVAADVPAASRAAPPARATLAPAAQLDLAAWADETVACHLPMAIRAAFMSDGATSSATLVHCALMRPPAESLARLRSLARVVATATQGSGGGGVLLHSALEREFGADAVSGLAEISDKSDGWHVESLPLVAIVRRWLRLNVDELARESSSTAYVPARREFEHGPIGRVGAGQSLPSARLSPRPQHAKPLQPFACAATIAPPAVEWQLTPGGWRPPPPPSQSLAPTPPPLPSAL